MGRLEKIVVLTVLFLVAVVLGVALTPTGDPNSRGQKGGPIVGAETEQSPVNSPDKNAQPNGLLNAVAETPTNNVDPKNASPVVPPTNDKQMPGTNVPPTPKVEPVVAKYILTTEGLKPSGAADMMFYTWKQGDTFDALALHFYGAKEKVTRLQKANEGRTDASMKVDETLWIPVADNSSDTTTKESGNVYVVKKGDVLSSISQQFYGTSKKWQKILDANRDTLASPEKLKVGMHLRIPE